MTKSKTALVKVGSDDNKGSKGSSTSYAGSYFSVNMKPTPAFKARGIEFWGTSKYNLDETPLTPQDLIVNCSGLLYTVKPFVTRFPSWMNLSSGTEQTPEQLLLEWKDMSVPPDTINLEFWETIIEQAIEHGITRIICCCGAGQGRTGTALAAFLMATGATHDPELAIAYIRGTYSSKAIENKSQENYVFDLIYPDAGQVFGKDSIPDDIDDPWENWVAGSEWQGK